MVLAQALSRLGFALFQSGDVESARTLLERAVTVNEEVYGPNHLSTEESLAWLGLVSIMSGQIEDAIPLLERCITIRRIFYGPDNPSVQQGLLNLADALMLIGGWRSPTMPARYRAQAVGDLAARQYERIFGVETVASSPRPGPKRSRVVPRAS